MRESILEFIEDKKVVRRSLYYGALGLLALMLIYGPFRITRISGSTMKPDLMRTEFYGTVVPDRVCVGDFIQFDKNQGNKVVRSVAAIGPSQFTLTNIGYQIDDKQVEMSPRWVNKARETLGPEASYTLGNNQIIAMRRAPDQIEDVKYEALLILETKDIDRHLSRIVISLKPSRIGKSLRNNPDNCISVP